MRSLSVVLIVCLARAAIADPRISAHISQRDIGEISAVVRAATREPILSINPVYESKPVPGAVPHKSTTAIIKAPGQLETRPIVIYERTDRVGVATGDYRNLKGGSYGVQKVGSTWKIVSKSFWIH